MNLVVDANILISCLIKTDGAVAALFLRPMSGIVFHAPELIRIEIALHRSKVARLTGYPEADVVEMDEVLLSKVHFVHESGIDAINWEKAFDLVKNIDEDDDQYVALALQLKCPLWTGDKKLMNGLRRKGFNLLITSEELGKALGT